MYQLLTCISIYKCISYQYVYISAMYLFINVSAINMHIYQLCIHRCISYQYVYIKAVYLYINVSAINMYISYQNVNQISSVQIIGIVLDKNGTLWYPLSFDRITFIYRIIQIRYCNCTLPTTKNMLFSL